MGPIRIGLTKCLGKIDLDQLSGARIVHLSGCHLKTMQKEAGMGVPHRRDHVECLACPVRVAGNFCSEIPDDEIEDLWRNRRHIAIGKRQAIVCESAPAQAHYNVVSGVVKLSRSTSNGRKQIVGFRAPGDFFTIPVAAEEGLHVEALTDAQLCRFSRMQFERLMTKHPRLQSHLLADTIRQIDALENHALLLGRRTAREKVANFLLQRQRAKTSASAHEQRIDIPMTRVEIADFLGLTPETVSRILAAFKREGLVTFGQTQYVWLLDMPALAQAASYSQR